MLDQSSQLNPSSAGSGTGFGEAGGGWFWSSPGVKGAVSNTQESGGTYEGRDGAEVYAAGALRKGKGKALLVMTPDGLSSN